MVRALGTKIAKKAKRDSLNFKSTPSLFVLYTQIFILSVYEERGEM